MAEKEESSPSIVPDSRWAFVAGRSSLVVGKPANDERLTTKDERPFSATPHPLDSASGRLSDESLPLSSPSCHLLLEISESRGRPRLARPDPAMHIAWSCRAPRRATPNRPVGPSVRLR